MPIEPTARDKFASEREFDALARLTETIGHLRSAERELAPVGAQPAPPCSPSCRSGRRAWISTRPRRCAAASSGRSKSRPPPRRRPARPAGSCRRAAFP